MKKKATKKKMMRNGGTPSAPVRGAMPRAMMQTIKPAPTPKKGRGKNLGQLNQQMKDLSKADMKALLISMLKGKSKLPNLEKAKKEAEAFSQQMKQKIEKAKKAK
jgi:hypothetical protein